MTELIQMTELILTTTEGAKVGQIECAATLALRALAAAKINHAILCLILGNVIKQGIHKALCVLRSHDNAVTYHGLRQTGKSGGKIKYKLTAGV